MSKFADLKGLIGRIKLGITRENGVQFEVEGLSVILSLSFVSQIASALNCTV